MKELTLIQKQIWLTQNLHQDSPLYNVGGYAVLDGNLDTKLLLTVLETVVEKMDALENTYSALNEQGLNFSHGFKKYDCALILNFVGNNDADAQIRCWIGKDMAEKFEVGMGLLKIRLIKHSENKYYWYVKAHHLVFDGFSMSLFFNKICYLYNNYFTKDVDSLNSQTGNYFEFWDEEKKYLLSKEYEFDKKFWIDRLQNLPGVKAFQSCLMSTGTQSLACKCKEIIISRELFVRIDNFCKNHACTPFHYFVSALFILNNRYNNEPPIIGLPVFNRKEKRFKNTLGTFINVLPFSVLFENHNTFLEILFKVKMELKTCYRHMRYPLLDVLKDIAEGRNLFNLIFSYQKNVYKSMLGDARVEINYIPPSEQQEDITLHLLEHSDNEDLKLLFSYKEDLFSEEGMEGLSNHYKKIVELLIRMPQVPISQLPLLDRSEKFRLTNGFNRTLTSYPKDKTVLNLFESQVANTPDLVALIFEQKELTYEEINERANQFAYYLISTYNIQPDDLVGIKLSRTDWFIVAILAILKTGAAYLPIDPEYPEERIEFMIKDSKAKIMVDINEVDKFSSSKTIYPTSNPQPDNGPRNLFCAIYTSGSTGTPKGCLLENRGVINNLFSKIRLLELKAADAICHTAEMYFVGAIWQLWAPLLVGGRVVLCNEEEMRDIPKLIVKAQKFNTNVLTLIPSQLNEYLFYKGKIEMGNIKRLILTGEKLNTHFVKRCYQGNEHLQIINTYGQTESSDDITFYIIPRQSSEERILIGRPVQNMQIYIIGTDGSICPIGVIGEICTSGDSLSRGYINRERLTSEKFVPNPFKKGSKMYKTGDLGRWLPGGLLEVIGRKDNQVKIRGYRIELDEIQRELVRFNGISDAVLAFQDDEREGKIIVAYIISKERPNVADIRSFLIKRLPSYMLPSRYVQLEKVPLLQNGKVDMHTISKMQENILELGIQYEEPENETEKNLVKIWEEILQKQRIGVNDNFFDLGGHSLLASTMVNKINDHFNIRISIKQIFEAHSIRSLGKEIQRVIWLQRSNETCSTVDNSREIIRI